jgi:hypothetical protein
MSFSCQLKVFLDLIKDSVSGLHLPEATHIFIVHPFWFGDDQHEKAIAAEKQGQKLTLILGIARAYRLGLQHPLNIVRFACKDTIEESIMLKRT